MERDEIKEAVKRNYSQILEQNSSCCGEDSSC